MATRHEKSSRPYEGSEQKIDRFETAICKGGLIQSGQEAVALLTVIARSNDLNLNHMAEYLQLGIANRLQESMNISPAIEPTTNSED